MGLSLYDTMSREKRVFEPADPKRVTMYVCGPTVYNHAHIGNFRAAVVFDLLYRVLRHQFGADHVVYARNFTDIDDKIIKASNETGQAISEITKKYADIYKQETAAFGVLAPTLEPRSVNLKVGRTALMPADTSRACNCVIPAGLKKMVLALSATAAEPA